MNLIILLITTIWYMPNYTETGYLDVPQLNNAIFLTALQSEGERVDLVIPPGEYLLPNNKQITMNNMVNLKCTGVTFKYKYESDYTLDLIHFQDRTKAGIYDLTLDLTEAYTDKKPSYKNADKFINRAVIQVEHSDSIILENITIKKILGSGIELANSSNCIIRNCQIVGSWVYGANSGVQGYGINLVGVLCRNNLIDSNLLKDQRHNIIIQYAAKHNTISKNKMYDVKALKKVWFLEVMDREFTFNLSLHGNSPDSNIISGNYADHRISVDNVKTIGNGKGNQIINNEVDGLIDVQSKAPYYNYNEGQVIKGNKCEKLRIEAINCINEGNIKIK